MGLQLLSLQKELIEISQSITNIVIEKGVYVQKHKMQMQIEKRGCTYINITCSITGPRALRALRIIPASNGGSSLRIGPRVSGIMYTSSEGNSLEIGTFPQYWVVHSPHGSFPEHTHPPPLPLLSQGDVLQNTRFGWKRCS